MGDFEGFFDPISGKNRAKDVFTNRRVNQSAEPISGTGSTQIDVGEQIIWRDTDDGKVYLMYNDINSGVKKIELI